MKNKQEIEDELNNRFLNEKIEILEWNGSTSPVTYKCLSCNNVFNLCQGYLLTRKNRKHLCNYCHKNTEEKTIEIKNKINSIVKKQNNLTIVKPFNLISESMIFHCNKCNSDFNRIPQIFLKNQKCPICNCVAIKKTDTFFKDQIQKLYDNDYEILNKYNDAYTKILVRHFCGFIYKTTPHNLLNGKECPQCSRFHSKGEKQIEKILNKYSIKYESQKKIEDESIKNLSFDFYLPEKNILIEYQGEQHYSKIEYFGGEEKFKKQLENDNKKREYCKNHNIQLLEIKYTDYNNIETIILGL